MKKEKSHRERRSMSSDGHNKGSEGRDRKSNHDKFDRDTEEN